MKKDVEYYMSLNYPIKVSKIEKVSEMGESGYFVEPIDLPGCMCDADTLEEIPVQVDEAKEAWIEGTLKRGGEVPLPGSREKQILLSHYQEIREECKKTEERRKSGKIPNYGEYCQGCKANNIVCHKDPQYWTDEEITIHIEKVQEEK